MTIAYISIIIFFITNFFLFKKALPKWQENKKILFYYIILAIFQSIIIYLVALGFINIIFSILLFLLLLFDLVYFLSEKMLKDKDLAMLTSIKFLKYFTLVLLGLFLSIAVFYSVFIFISKL